MERIVIIIYFGGVMKLNNLKKHETVNKTIMLEKITKNLIEMNQLSKLEMINSLLEETIEQTNNSIKKYQTQQTEEINKLKKINIKSKIEIDELKNVGSDFEEIYTKEIDKLSKKMDDILVMKVEQVTKTTVEYITKLQELSTKTHKNLNKMQSRGKLIDIFIYLNLGIMPILSGIVLYLFLK